MGDLTDLIATFSRLPRGNAHPTLGIGYRLAVLETDGKISFFTEPQQSDGARSPSSGLKVHTAALGLR